MVAVNKAYNDGPTTDGDMINADPEKACSSVAGDQIKAVSI